MFDVPIGEELVVSTYKPEPDPKTLALEWSTNDGNPSPSKKYKLDLTLRFKATNLDGTFAPAWIGYGNAFAAQEEVDQAMLGYRTAACLFPGCHLPTLYIGMEYMRNHSFKLAEQAKTICPSDPLVYNELGVVAYHMKDVWIYHEAISCYERALTLLNRSLSTYAGLAYTYHLQDNFSAAITYYHKALWLKPDDQFCTEMLSLALVDEGRHGIDPKIEFE
ncbi:Anaphase-promoting complex subunit 6 [Citrus sinensis]|uniref:Anaphase-promoting complex subunit 6 n=1 Tax=Citrus sinensis TaxID=2711 RepID=A0ACB8M095_CITSI|nr:Anaphase-promoting complex subunit 6 [Citrus sinensis]